MCWINFKVVLMIPASWFMIVRCPTLKYGWDTPLASKQWNVVKMMGYHPMLMLYSLKFHLVSGLALSPWLAWNKQVAIE